MPAIPGSHFNTVPIQINLLENDLPDLQSSKGSGVPASSGQCGVTSLRLLSGCETSVSGDLAITREHVHWDTRPLDVSQGLGRGGSSGGCV